MPPTFTALIVESDRSVARQVQRCLEPAGFDVSRALTSVRDAAALLAASLPDVVVMDLALVSDPHAMRAFYDLVGRSTPIIYLTASTDRGALERAAEGLAAGCVIKPFTDRQLVSTVMLAIIVAERSAEGLTTRRLTHEEKLRSIAAIVSDISPDDESATAVGPVRREGAAPGTRAADLLSTRERQIVDLLANGARVVTIAQRLQLSPHTVRNHLKSVFRKLNLHGQHELFEYWHQHAS